MTDGTPREVVEGPEFAKRFRLAGPVGAVAGLGGIGTAIATSPWFTWTGDALSDLGHPARASAPLFNGGLILGGILGVAFALSVLAARRHPVTRGGAVIVGVGMANMAFVGVFDVTHPLHEPVAVAFFLAITYGWFVHGTGLALAGQVHRGVGTIWLGVVHLSGWLIWAAVGVEGIALPETVGALLLAVWIAAEFRDLGADYAA